MAAPHPFLRPEFTLGELGSEAESLQKLIVLYDYELDIIARRKKQ